MSLVTLATDVIERVPLPDRLTSAGISLLVDRTRRRLARGGGTDDAEFARLMAGQPIARRPDAANAQHYEVPAAFFARILGPRRKYSCCRYLGSSCADLSGGDGTDTLAAAEVRALEETACHADLADGQDILELGCGWGSLSLWMAERFPAARITAISNSGSQRVYIEAEAARRGFGNLRVITADMNDFANPASIRGDLPPHGGGNLPPHIDGALPLGSANPRAASGSAGPGEWFVGCFDRIVSVEMFEHMSNWQSLLRRVHGWLRPDGRLFVHVFSHRSAPYQFDTADREDWIAQHFFTGGIMPSHGLIRHVAEAFEVEAEWRWNGTHYARTARDWLANFDRNEAEITGELKAVYGADTALWKRRWRLFFLATAGLFGHAGGAEWGVSHYRLRPLDA